MRLVKVVRDGRVAAGLLEGGEVRIAGDWRAGEAAETPFPLAARLGELDAIRGEAGETVPLDEVRLAPPIDPSAKILCVGMNYRDHVSEIKLDVAENPTIFQRFADSLVGHEDEIQRPSASETFDFEGEIAVVIGRHARHVSAADAMSYVGGYTCVMDGSVRQFQRHSLTAGKNWYRSGSIGPWLVPAGDVPTDNPKLETRVNGTVMQSARADQMIFDIPRVIEYCSRFTPLRPGDVIATGTPGGVGSRREPPAWLKAGDRVEVEVEGIGVLANTVVDER